MQGMRTSFAFHAGNGNRIAGHVWRLAPGPNKGSIAVELHQHIDEKPIRKSRLFHSKSERKGMHLGDAFEHVLPACIQRSHVLGQCRQRPRFGCHAQRVGFATRQVDHPGLRFVADLRCMRRCKLSRKPAITPAMPSCAVLCPTPARRVPSLEPCLAPSGRLEGHTLRQAR